MRDILRNKDQETEILKLKGELSHLTAALINSKNGIKREERDQRGDN